MHMDIERISRREFPILLLAHYFHWSAISASTQVHTSLSQLIEPIRGDLDRKVPGPGA